MGCNKADNWTREWPTEPGYYWFYGYRYGKTSCGRNQEKELCFVKAKKAASGLILIDGGSFLFRSEPEDFFFKKVTLPSLPVGVE